MLVAPERFGETRRVELWKVVSIERVSKSLRESDCLRYMNLIPGHVRNYYMSRNHAGFLALPQIIVSQWFI